MANVHGEILKPVITLVAWSLAMLAWTIAVRLPAMRRAGVDLGKLIGTKASDADRSLPAAAQWKAHNYNHLMEQPTLFYAIAIVLAVVGDGGGLNAELGWAYVGLRIAHSLVQATTNRVLWRFVLFITSSVVLGLMTVRAGVAVFG